MPITEQEWKNALQSSNRDPAPSDSGARAEIIEFLEKHDDQAFTLSEIAENVNSPFPVEGDSGGLGEKVKKFIASAGEKRAVKYFLNQLVAEGHVETRIFGNRNTETVYYRIR